LLDEGEFVGTGDGLVVLDVGVCDGALEGEVDGSLVSPG